MTASHLQGPSVTLGYVPGTTGGSNPEAGPSAEFQGSTVVDVRFPVHPGMTGLGHVKAFTNYNWNCLQDAQPQALSATQVGTIAASSVVPAGGTLFNVPGLASTNNSNARAVNVPLVPFGRGLSAANRVSVMTLDPNHTKVTTSVGSKTVTIPAGSDARLLTKGQYICIPGALTATTCLVARVVNMALNSIGAGTLTLDTAAGAVVTNGPLMLMDMTGASVVPFFYQGAVAPFDPHGTVARALTFTSNNVADTGYSVTVNGYDAFGNAMSENTSITANAAVTGRKAFKHITTVNLVKSGGGTLAGTITIGTSDIFGMSMKMESWEYMNVYWAATYINASTGWTAGDATTATLFTGDTRGTYAVQSASDGSKRLAVFMTVPARQALYATWDNYQSLYGVPQA